MAKTLFRRITKKAVIIANSILVLFFLLSALTPWLRPEEWWWVSLLGLGFPFLLVAVFLFSVCWLFVRPRWSLLGLLAIALAWKSVSACLAFHIPGKFNLQKAEGDIRLMQWNVMRFGEMNKSMEQGRLHRNRMFDVIRDYNADILCFQEFFHADNPRYSPNITDLQKEGYPYFYFTKFPDCYTCYYGLSIFSKYPIVDSVFVEYPGKTASEDLIYVDIKKGDDTFRVFTTHLQSVQFGRREYRGIEKIKNTEDSLLEASRGIISKLRKGFVYRSRQADTLRSLADESPYPEIVTGDFNDVPSSYTYFTIRGSRQDAFLQKGLGIGRTFTSLSPSLRIDYVLPDKRFDIVQYYRPGTRLSDHYPIITDLRLKK